MNMLQSIMDASSHAMFTLDRDGMITNINQQAKHDFGLYSRSGSSHGPGRLEPGDVIIIGDSALGADDGGLLPEDLERLGICVAREGDAALFSLDPDLPFESLDHVWGCLFEIL